MKETPIIFSTPMVQAILDGRKTMTRRIFKKQPIPIQAQDGFKFWNIPKLGPVMNAVDKSPYGKPGDLLWVREKFIKCQDAYVYATDKNSDGLKWKPSIHMPKSAARIWLRITDVRLERLQDISEEDAISEGVFFHDGLQGYSTDINGSHFHCSMPVNSFRKLWININGSDSWDCNHWIWVLSFEVISKNGKNF